jgi:hypothetical protein
MTTTNYDEDHDGNCLCSDYAVDNNDWPEDELRITTHNDEDDCSE